MTSKIVREIIDKHLDPEREFIYGFADLTSVIDSQFGDFRYGISIGKRLDNRIIDKIRNGPTLATRAGLGWIGKSDLFISKAFGPRLRLVSILTNRPLDSDSPPIEKSRCGTCNICVQMCPAKAIDGKLWDITVHREEFFDPFKCRRKCKEFGEKYLKMDVRVCGICVSVCPVGS